IFIITYNIQKHVLLPDKLEIYKCWVIITSAKISEKWILKLINGIMEYDKKVTSTLTLNVFPIKKKNWKLIFICVFAYHVGKSVLTLIFIPNMRVIELKIVPVYFIAFLSNAFDVTLLISTYFYLENLEYRFHTLNGFWSQLQDRLTTTPIVETSWTHDEITMRVDVIRRLHAELCELLKIFSTGFGQMLVAFFLFIYISIVFSFFYSIELGIIIVKIDVTGIMMQIIIHLMTIRYVFFIMSIIIAASRVKDTKNKMISHLRLIRISSLSVNNKLQFHY
ncbi:Gustatory receptor, partial [Aphis craccivora]